MITMKMCYLMGKVNVAVVYHGLNNELHDKLSSTAIVKVVFYAD
ncbi:hypothetical protein GCM10008018_67520 [Paenibacillus marchantiophytorum]|uniref:Uncharacterized protein n=1 Tax=Paenibacillus marchantiophytorum TaxID=1619310 RepID=A0ABQ1FHE1_9BACL|nr:hypothetical protein GCM10008018_67520 [Paenibacillus marchantiophytorum]